MYVGSCLTANKLCNQLIYISINGNSSPGDHETRVFHILFHSRNFKLEMLWMEPGTFFMDQARGLPLTFSKQMRKCSILTPLHATILLGDATHSTETENTFSVR